MRRKWAKPRTKAEKMAARDRGIFKLLRCGFSRAEIADALGLSRRRVDQLVRQLEAIHGGPIEPVPEMVAYARRVEEAIGYERPEPAPSVRDRVEAALKERPDASLRDLMAMTGASEPAIRKALEGRGPVRSHARRARERAERRPRIVEALRTSPGESPWSIAKRTGLPEHEVRVVAKDGAEELRGK